MRLDRVLKQASLAVLVVILTAGCSGINASKSISPASFFLPGLLQNTPEQPGPAEVVTNITTDSVLAQVR
jgi:hypothetical protein